MLDNESQGGLQPVEIKSGATFVTEWLAGVRKWVGFAGEDALPPRIVYGGDDSYVREGVQVRSWRSFGE